MNAGEIDPGRAQLVAHVASITAGYRCCQAHTAAHAAHLGVDVDKIAAVWDKQVAASLGISAKTATPPNTTFSSALQ